MTVRSFKSFQPKLGARVFIDDTACVIGRVALGEDVSVFPQSVIRGDVNHIRIGARTNIQDACVLHVTHASPHNPDGFALSVGCDVTVGHRVVLHGCEIGDQCLIGMGALVMDGAVIEEHTIVGAGALVTPGKRLSGGKVWCGSPARAVRDITPAERELFLYSARHYVELKNAHAES